MLYKGTLMEISSSNLLPLLLGSVGLIILFRLLQSMKDRAIVQDAVVVITGASSGLGKECARVFHAAGARLVLCGRNKQKLEELVKELTGMVNNKNKTHTPHIVTFDLADLEAVRSSAHEILNCFGQVDILINNGGISYRGNILDTAISVDKDVMNTNYFGPIALTKAILPSMVQRRSGHVAVISSVQGKIAIPFRSAYAASKHATQAFFDCLRAEVEQYGVKVTIISPGYIRTNLSLNAVTGNGSKYGVMDKNTAEGYEPRVVAEAVLTAVCRRKKDVLLAGFLPTVAVYLRTLIPSLFFPIMTARAKKERKMKDN
ncbi:dehydrogenase/reductase SDR family member 7B isoform X2 [Hemiscyllium ocellatum]|nr:dehydrogenase/reductase SDR family member 7B isoform X2 [Hemiscyllium ocellatum]XP_060696308.1 dehydrogenase/reductase SDR family member 7B isoform X2 [Hemiscyllium ocellatum]XP_060696309.1 dehydrogenase/reductase SDR family member 7B isoform X2 [Hemiscyllium ocellatum]XP_060696311.1 dehydrogenase/reductase SDR family member 7B isoform X2 [Hemiscyllium ocellatum]